MSDQSRGSLAWAEAAEVIRTFGRAVAEHREVLNRLNVYPVPDGDTGTNMALTLTSVIEELDEVDASDRAAFCQAVSHGSLMGARGNSGVILSQILRGLCEVFGESDAIDGPVLVAGLTRAADLAYGAVLQPVEGTILTVARGVADGAAQGGPNLVDVLDSARRAGHDALARTPEQLEALARAGVVDAGGAGYLLLVDAALHVVDGRPLPDPDVAAAAELHPPRTTAAGSGSSSAASPTSSGEPRYEVMFLLEAPDDEVDGFRARWADIGESIVVVGGDGLWNCHIHCDDIGGAIEAGISAGRPYRIEVTDLSEQVEEVAWVAAARPAAAGCSVVAVSSGPGLDALLRSLGVTVVVVGGQTMNPSTHDLLAAVNQAAADEVVILPNNSNIIAVAEQVDAQTEVEVRVVPTKSVVQALAALLDYRSEDGAEANAERMVRAAEAVRYGEVTRSVRAAQTEIGPVAEGDWLGLGGGRVQVSAPSLVQAATDLLEAMIEPDSELVTVVAGEGAGEEETTAVLDWLGTSHPDIEAEVHDGGQPLYPYVFGVE